MNEMVEDVAGRAGSIPADTDCLPDLEDEVSLKGLALAPVKRKRAIIISALLGLLAAILVSVAMTPRYRATAILELNGDKQGGVVALDDLAPANPGGADELKVKMQTEIAVIEDNSIALAVLSKLGMLRVGTSGLFSSGAEHVVSEDALTPRQREQLIDAFEGHLKVEEVGSSRLIAITYTSKDPVQAAHVANQVAAEYKTYLLSSNFSSSKEVSQWLARQLSEQLDRAAKSEQAAADFERTHKSQAMNDDDTLKLGVLKEQARSSRELYDLLYAKLQKEDINSASSATNVRIVDPARPPGTPWMPQPLLFAGAGLGAGLLFGLALAFFLESQDDRVADNLQAEALTDGEK